jgi:hypothetical protein
MPDSFAARFGSDLYTISSEFLLVEFDLLRNQGYGTSTAAPSNRPPRRSASAVFASRSG